MFVTDDLLKEIRYVFVGFFDSEKNEQGEFLQKNRKKIKILVETIAEQLVGNYFKHKYVNVPTALLTINNHLDQLSDYDRSLFRINGVRLD